MDESRAEAQPTADIDIRRSDRELAAQLSTARHATRATELLQLAAIYAELPESRRQHWFRRLSAVGVPPQVLEQIVERAGKTIRFGGGRASHPKAGSSGLQLVPGGLDRRRPAE